MLLDQRDQSSIGGSDQQQPLYDDNLRLQMMELKNQLFDQQFGFEKQICLLIQNLMKDRKQEEISILEIQKVQKISLDDIGALQKFVSSLIDGVETLKSTLEEKTSILEVSLTDLTTKVGQLPRQESVDQQLIKESEEI